ncbi:MAG TPA: GxxExxY protein [Planctomycetota bacterium]
MAARQEHRKGKSGDPADAAIPGEEATFRADKLTEAIIGGVIRVHSTLGPGFVESIYRRALVLELSRGGLAVEPEREIDVFYLGERVGWHRMDLVVERKVIVELKAVEKLVSAHYAQLRSCLKASRLIVGLLVNFGGSRADYRRVHPV